MKKLTSEFLFLLSCFAVFAVTAFAEDRYLGTIPAGGSNLVAVWDAGQPTLPDGGGIVAGMNLQGFVVPAGAFITLQAATDAGEPFSTCIQHLVGWRAFCEESYALHVQDTLHTKCPPSPTSLLPYQQPLPDGGALDLAVRTNTCIVYGLGRDVKVFLRRGDER